MRIVYPKGVVKQCKMYKSCVMSKYFGIWPTVSRLSGDFDVPYPRAAAWVYRGEIPGHYDARTQEFMRGYGFDVELAELHAWHAKCREFRCKSKIRLVVDVPELPFRSRDRKVGV